MGIYNIENDIEKILIDEESLDKCVCRISNEIEKVYENSKNRIVLVCVLKGSLIFASELMKRIRLPIEIDFIHASSYGADTISCGNVSIKSGLSRQDITDCEILVVEDILDTGHTLSKLLAYLKERGALSVKLCTLLNKPSRRQVEVPVDFEGFSIPDEFVVGYGLDFNEKYRNLPYIGILKKEIYKNI